jgi:hypothetical protein
MARISQCNVLDPAGSRRFWRFHAGSSGNVSLASDRTGQVTNAAFRRHAAKSWSALWQPRLNLAWLPLEQVFLRVLQLPKCEFDEVLSMVEFQLDRLSPMPLTQIVWTAEIIPHKGATPSETQTVLVLIASRQAVEGQLGRLEGEGYLADRMEPAFLHQLLGTEVKEDGIWVYPQTGEASTFCLAAWWYSGTLQTLNLVHLTAPENWNAELGEEIRKAAWAGELEGWLTGPPKWHLVADAATAEAWLPVLAPLSDRAVDVAKPLDAAELATASARGVAAERTRANLVPVELSTRYHQRFVDSLWIRGLGAVLTLYLMAVVGYFGWLQYLQYEKHNLERQIAELEPTYKKVQEMKARIAVQEQQIALRYAALDCLRAAAENLPQGLTLENFNFSRGSEVTIIGRGGANMADKVADYVEGLGKFQIEGRPFFSSVGPHSSSTMPNNEIRWSFPARINTGLSE